MDTGDWELAGEAEEELQRVRRKKNEAFRRKLERKKVERYESQRLAFATAVATLVWVYVGVQSLLHR